MMEFSCFSNSPNGHTYTHTHTHCSVCKDSNSNCLLLSLDPSSSCKCTFFCVVQSIFFCFAWIFFCGFYTQYREGERERKTERDTERSCKACYVFNLSTICKRCTIQGSQLSLCCLPPLFQYLQSLQFHLRFYMLFMGELTYKKREKEKWKTIVSLNGIFYENFQMAFSND